MDDRRSAAWPLLRDLIADSGEHLLRHRAVRFILEAKNAPASRLFSNASAEGHQAAVRLSGHRRDHLCQFEGAIDDEEAAGSTGHGWNERQLAAGGNTTLLADELLVHRDS